MTLAVAHLCSLVQNPNFCPGTHLSFLHKSLKRRTSSVHGTHPMLVRTVSRTSSFNVCCSAANKPSSSTEISSTAKIRNEVLNPFRSVRMFFYLAFVASGALGGLIATTQLVSALANPSKADAIPEMLKGLGIDIGAVFIFAFLYSSDRNAKNAQLAKLSREESLSNLKLCVDEKKVISVSALRGIARLVILAGPASFIEESFRLSKPFTESLLDRGVLVVPFATDGSIPSLEFEESEKEAAVAEKKKRLWQLRPVYTSEWVKWLDEQKRMANVSPDSPVVSPFARAPNNDDKNMGENRVAAIIAISPIRQQWLLLLGMIKYSDRKRYLSLRMDGRVRGSGVGYPPWNAFSVQLPPVKGLWSGLLDGMDGRVL